VGFRYDPGDLPRMAVCIRNWYENRESLERARHAAWNWATCRYNWDLESITFLSAVETAWKPEARRALEPSVQ
jgi:hypothetical protein